MSDGKSYWSTLPGVVTGVASIVTAIVGLLGISVQAGWLGGDDNKASSSNDGVTTTTASTLPGATTSSSVAAAKQGEFTVQPDSVTFESLGAKEATVVVKNTGDVPLVMRKPTVSVGSTAFSASDLSCTATALPPEGRCEIKVTFITTQPGAYTGALTVAADKAPKAVEVELKGTRGLLG